MHLGRCRFATGAGRDLCPLRACSANASICRLPPSGALGRRLLRRRTPTSMNASQRSRRIRTQDLSPGLDGSRRLIDLRLTRWPLLVSVEAIPELHESSETDTSERIGAALPLERHRPRVEQRAARRARVARSLRVAAHSKSRHACGNLATASPIGDAAPLLLALDAS